MKNVTCRYCGDTRPAIIAFEGCKCGSEEISLKLGALAEMINSRDAATLNCGSCNASVFGIDVDAYPHPGGWNVPGLKDHKWWLSIECPKCKYETSFDKFGIAK